MNLVSRAQTWLALPFVLLWIVSGVSPASAEKPEERLDGQPIVRIVFDRINIFDTSQPEVDKWFYRAANSLHIISKEPFLRSMLLFTEGDLYSQHQANESARILRGLGFINPCEITATPVEGGVEVNVETHDQWTLQVGANAGVFGNRKSWGIEFQETNFLGRGKKLDVEYESDVERDSITFGYFDPNIRGTRWRTELRYADLTDGFLERVMVDRPFYSLATRRAWGGIWERGELTQYLYSLADPVVSGPAMSTKAEVWYGMRTLSNEAVTRRLSFGFTHDHTTFQQWTWEDTDELYPTPEDRLVDGPFVRFERVKDNFHVVEGFRAWNIQEDVAMGPNVSVGATISLPAFGGDKDRYIFDGRLDVGFRSGNWLALTEAWFEGRIDDGDPANWVVGVSAGAAQLGRRGFQFRVLYENSYNLDRDRQLPLGAEMGLRGWSPLYFDGTGRALANAQWRTLVVSDLFHVLALGFEVFVDAGATWDPRVGPDTDGLRMDAGVGLILGLQTIGLSNVARIEIGFPDDNSGSTLIITTSALF